MAMVAWPASRAGFPLPQSVACLPRRVVVMGTRWFQLVVVGVPEVGDMVATATVFVSLDRNWTIFFLLDLTKHFCKLIS
jgi:hypothetical protein